MAGISSGRPQWDDLPQRLGLTIDAKGAMSGVWQGVSVSAQLVELPSHHTGNPRSINSYQPARPHTSIHARLDPPLGVDGLDRNYHFDRIADYAFRADLKARAQTCGFFNLQINDEGITCSRIGSYESSFEVYRAVFDLFAWAAKTLLARRAQCPPPWEYAIAQAWTGLGADWGMQLDARRGELSGVVRGRPTRARVINSNGVLMTSVEVSVSLSPGLTIWLTPQYEAPGLLDSIFETVGGTAGSDIKVGDATFDAAFIIQSPQGVYIGNVLTAPVRQQLLGFSRLGASIAIGNGSLTVTTKRFLASRDELDPVMKSTYAAAAAIGAPMTPSTPPAMPYR